MDKKNTWVIGITFILLGTTITLGQSHRAIGQSHKSTGQTTGMNIAPDTPAHQARMIEIGHLDKKAAAALDADDYATAEDAARRSVSLGVGSGRGEEFLAQALFEQGKDGEALRVYRTIAERGANATRNEFPYALLLLKAGRWPQAVAAYDTALTLGGDTDLLRQSTRFSPDMPQPRQLEAAIRVGLGVTSLGVDAPGDQRRNSLALAHLQRALALEPNSGLVRYYYGYALQRVGRKVEAEAAFHRAAQVAAGPVKAAAEQAFRR